MNDPTKEQREAAMEFCPDELDHQFHTDKYPCVKIAQFLAARDAELLRPWMEAVEKIDHMVKSAHSPRWKAVGDITRALLSEK